MRIYSATMRTLMAVFSAIMGYGVLKYIYAPAWLWMTWGLMWVFAVLAGVFEVLEGEEE